MDDAQVLRALGDLEVQPRLDDTGTVRVEWPFGFSSEDRAAEMESLLEEAQS